MAALGAWIAGAYTVTFDSQLMGVTEAGFEVIERPAFNVIRQDVTGRTPVDTIQTGVEDIVVRVEGLEWSATLFQKAAMYAYASSTQGRLRASGVLGSSLAKTLTLTPVTGNAVSDGKTWTYLALPLEPIRTIFSSQRQRTIPMGFFALASAVDNSTKEATMYALSG